MNKFKDYDSDILDVDEVDGTDVKINPDYYIHRVLDSSTSALSNPDFELGRLQYVLLVRQLEIFARSSGHLYDNYEKEVNNFIKSKDYSNEDDEKVKSIMLAQKKLELITTEIFSSKVTVQPLKS